VSRQQWPPAGRQRDHVERRRFGCIPTARDSSGRNSPHLDLAFPCQGGMILNPYDGELDGRSRARLQTEAAGA